MVPDSQHLMVASNSSDAIRVTASVDPYGRRLAMARVLVEKRIVRPEAGFTLIELMVVVLIIAILLAIAIPTFLGARDSANARAAQANLRNALTAEQQYYTNGQLFSSTTTSMAGIESAINWTTGIPVTTTPNQVSVITNSPTNDIVTVQAQGKDGNCYFIQRSNNAGTSYTGYAETKGTCVALTTPSAATPTAGSAASNVGSAGSTPVYYTAF